MAALTLTAEQYRDKILGGWIGKSVGVTFGAAQRGKMIPGRYNFYNPVPGQPGASVALDFPLVWLHTLEECGPETAPEDLAVAWLEHLDYSQDEYGYAALNLRRGLPPPASGNYANWFRHSSGGLMRADFWAMLAPGAPQVAAAYAYHDAFLDHSEEGLWGAMFLAAVGSAAFFLTDPMILLTVGLAMIPRTSRVARAVKTAIAAAQRGAGWLEARESVQHEVGNANFTDSPQNLGFFTIGLLYGTGDFGTSLCAGVNCGYDAEAVGGALGAIFGFRLGKSGLPQNWTQPVGDILIPGHGVRDFDAPQTLTEIAERTFAVGRKVISARCPDVEIVETFVEAASAPPAPVFEPPPAPTTEMSLPPTAPDAMTPSDSMNLTAPPPEPSPDEIPPETPVPNAWLTEAVGEATAASEAAEASLPPAVPPESEAIPEPTAAIDTTEGSATAVSLGVLTPQPVSPSAPPLQPATSPDALNAGPPLVAPDLVGAIAWADSTLVKPLLVTPPNALTAQAGVFEVLMDTGDAPAIAYNQPKMLSFSVVNRGADAFTGRVQLLAPPGWQIGEPAGLGQRQYLAPHTGTFRADFTVRAPEGAARIEIANAITLRFTPENGGQPFEAEFLLLGASCWWTVGPFANFDGEGFDRSYLPEDRPGLNETYPNRLMQSAGWEKRSFTNSTLDLESLFKGSSGVVYGQTILRCPVDREARLVANTNSGVKVWLGGTLVLRRYNREPFRPVLGSGNWAVDVTLRAGDNPVMVKWVRGSEPFAFSLTVSDRYGRGIPEVSNTSW